eukprot:TRINITY_DN8839_c0_g1_i1.p1 TRINITY_DN8839_c0_g1~~TRINITY_DN8839_c0_g1_i1.p1  ORF type:complete len:441 (+),score=106.02 TRINITY_DN8839_c0_g1_i1:1025-2347(+)
MGRKGKGKKMLTTEAAELDSNVPRTFVINRTKLGISATHLMLEMRRVMEPYTAASLKARKRNVLKDYVAVAGPLGITHFLLFGRSEKFLNLRICRLPKGPTLTFRVTQYTLMKDVAASIPKPKAIGKQFLNPPLLVLNNFGANTLQIKLVQRVFQNMFPSINISEVNLSGIKRVALFNMNDDTGEIEFRHYDISLKPVGLSKSVKSVLKSNIPDLSKYDDISDYILSQAGGYESDGDAMAEQVELPEELRKTQSDQSAVKLTELGPRMNLKLLKIEEGLAEGKVLYHSIITKTSEEESATEKKRLVKSQLKIKRKKQQDANIKRKEAEKKAHRERSLAGQKKPQEEGTTPMYESDDDAEYYRSELGQEPPKELGLSQHKGQGRGGAPFRVVRRGRGRGRGASASGRGRGDGQTSKPSGKRQPSSRGAHGNGAKKSKAGRS